MELLILLGVLFGYVVIAASTYNIHLLYTMKCNETKHSTQADEENSSVIAVFWPIALPFFIAFLISLPFKWAFSQ